MYFLLRTVEFFESGRGQTRISFQLNSVFIDLISVTFLSNRE